MRQNGSWVVLAIVALFAVEAVAVETDAELRRFQRRIWTVEQGLPHDGVLAVAQTTDGYLWFATLRGLARFDGVNFTNFTDKSSTLTPDTIADVTAGPLDDLWIAHTSLSHYQNGTFTSWDASKGLPEKVTKVRIAKDGTIWAMGRRKLIHFDGRTFRSWGTAEGLPEASLTSLALDSLGNVWLGTIGAGAVLFDGRRFKFFGAAQGFKSRQVDVVADRKGNVLLAGDADLVLRSPDGRLTRWPTGTLPGSPLSLNDDGSVWASYGNGLARWKDGKATSFSQSDGLAGGGVTAVFKDREGTLWITSELGGVTQLIDSTFTNYTTRDGLLSDPVQAVLQDRRGTIWAGAPMGGLARLDPNDRFHPFTLADGVPNDVTALAEGTDGTLWVGTDSGIFGYRDRRFRKVSDERSVTDIAVDHRGAVWVATWGRGLEIIEGNRQVATITPRDGLAGNVVRYVRELSDGTMIVSTSGGTQIIRDRHPLPKLPFKGGLAGVSEDPDGTRWMMIENLGIVCIRNGKTNLVDAAHGVLVVNIHGMLDDGAGSLWVTAMNGGVARYRKSELDDVVRGRAARMHPRVFSTEDGLGSSYAIFGTPTGIRARDGSLWFPTSRGLSVLRHNPDRPVVAPRASIESLSADNGPVTGNESRIAPGARRVAIRFTAPTMLNGAALTFQYRLDGFDEKWSEPSMRRLVEYTNLRPGRYAFRVRVSNREGSDGANEATLPFILEPRLIQTFWFRMLTGLVMACFLVAVYLVRMGTLRRRADDLRRVVDERTRQLREANSQLEQSISQLDGLMKNDDVTGVATRRHFDRQLAGAVREASRDATPLSLVLIEVEGFAHYRDFFGRRRADVCLRQVAAVLRQGTPRSCDLVAHYGGDEFAIALPGCILTEATMIAERLALAVEALAIPTAPAATSPFVSIRIGVAGMAADANADSLISGADASRRAGRAAVHHDAA